MTRPVVGRFVAGATRTDALRTATDLVDGVRVATVDLLGEDTRSAEQADRTVRAYRSLLAAVGDAGFSDRVEVSVEVSVKVSALGQSLADGHRVSVANARSIRAAAADRPRWPSRAWTCRAPERRYRRTRGAPRATAVTWRSRVRGCDCARARTPSRRPWPTGVPRWAIRTAGASRC